MGTAGAALIVSSPLLGSRWPGQYGDVVHRPTPPAQPTCTDGAVRLVAIGEDATQLRATLTAQRLPLDQQRFAAPAVESLPQGDADPRRLSVAILVRAEPVGMFALDRGGYLRECDDDPRAVLLRAFYVAPEHQGHGYGRAAVAVLPSFVRDHLPDVRRVVLTVNHENPGAIKTYLAGGLTDTGQNYLGGAAGAQHVFELRL
jgi:GNAT superfamily N-acetyltransferase